MMKENLNIYIFVGLIFALGILCSIYENVAGATFAGCLLIALAILREKE